MGLHVLDHPLAADLLATLRDRHTGPHQFRTAARTLSTLLAIEATRGLNQKIETVYTPLEETPVQRLAQGLAVVPVLRAGLSMLEPFLDLFPDVAVGYVGLERDHVTAQANSYYCKLPPLVGKAAIVADPMLATGGSASQALDLVAEHNPATLSLVCVVAAPEGVARVQRDHPSVHIYTAALDRGLNSLKYILPGLGDYGDRLYGTH